jgi:hypothetical protein
MAEAPAEILGYYCALDAYSTYELFDKVMLPAILALPVPSAIVNIYDYHAEFIKQVRLHIEQQLRGIDIDELKLAEHATKLQVDIKLAEKEFLTHEDIKPHVRHWNAEIAKEYYKKQPAKYKKPPKLGQEPVKYTKAGKLSKVWESWKAKKEKLKHPVISKNWLTWEENYKKVCEKNHFNINSGPQRQWLFYEQMGYPVVIKTDKGEPAVDKKALLGGS